MPKPIEVDTSVEHKNDRERLSIESSYLFVFDFDGTMFQTFEPSPSGIGVEENYEKTLKEIFGPDILATYLADGGLDNRNPGEVIRDLLAKHPELIQRARAHLDANKDALLQTTPDTAHLLEAWETDPLRAATEVYIRQDLANSLDHIGLLNDDQTFWPRPTNNFIETWKTIDEINKQNLGFHIDTAILSSGYVDYIDKTLKTWSLQTPDVLVTDDQMRARPHPADIKRRVKPAPLGLALVHQKWLDLHGLDANTLAQGAANKDGTVLTTRQWAETTRERMFMFGDSVGKDGAMAEKSHIGFAHYDLSASEFSFNGEYSSFNNWQDIAKILKKNRTAMKGAVAINTIMRMDEIAG